MPTPLSLWWRRMDVNKSEPETFSVSRARNWHPSCSTRKRNSCACVAFAADGDVLVEESSALHHLTADFGSNKFCVHLRWLSQSACWLLIIFMAWRVTDESMPAVFLDRLPLPSLQAYTVGSVLLLACSVHYAVQVTSQIGLKLNGTEIGIPNENSAAYRNSTIGIRHDISFGDIVFERVYIRKAVEVLYFMLQEPMCIWVSSAFFNFVLV